MRAGEVIVATRPAEVTSEALQTLPPATPAKPTGPAGRLLVLIGLVFLLREAQAVVVPISAAIVFTFVLSPSVRFLRRRGIPEFVGAAILVTSLVACTGFLLALLAAPASDWWERAPATLEDLVKRGEQLGASIGLFGSSRLSTGTRATRNQTPAAEDPVKQKIFTESVALTGLVIGRVFSFAISVVATVLLLYFLLASEHWLLSRTVAAIGRRRKRALLLSGIRSAQREIGRFIRALTIINLAVGVITGALLSYLAMPNPLLWGCLAAVLNFIPYLGAIIMTGLLVLGGVASFSATPSLILAPAAAFMLVHAVESNLISPWFIGRQLALSRISVFLSVMFWGWLWGVAGALLAVPLLIGLRNACRRIPRLRWLALYLEANRRPIPTLSALLKESGLRGGGLRLRRRSQSTGRQARQAQEPMERNASSDQVV